MMKREKITKNSSITKKLKNIYNDISNFKKIKKKEIQKAKPQIIFHLAAQPLVADSYVRPLNTFNTNFVGSVNIFEISRLLNIKSIVVITSDKCYLNKEIKRGYKEIDQLGGKDPYSASKASVEIAFQSYLHSFFNNKKNIGIATARAGNVIGGGDWSKNRIIPDCIKTVIRKKFNHQKPFIYETLAARIRTNFRLFNFRKKTIQKAKKIFRLMEFWAKRK